MVQSGWCASIRVDLATLPFSQFTYRVCFVYCTSHKLFVIQKEPGCEGVSLSVSKNKVVALNTQCVCVCCVASVYIYV